MSDNRCMFCLGPCDNPTLLSPVCKCPALYHDYCGEQWYKTYKDTCPICRKVVAGGKPTVRVVAAVAVVQKKPKEMSPLKVTHVQRQPVRPSAPPVERFVSIEEYVVIESVPALSQRAAATPVPSQQPTQFQKIFKVWATLSCLVLTIFAAYMILHNVVS